MRLFFQRLLLPAALLGLAWFFYGRMDRSLRQPALPARPAAAVPARLQPVGTQLRAERAEAVKPAALADRFERSPVLAVRESVRGQDGQTRVHRVRLVRTTGFKYPLVRVVDELVRGPDGDRLIRQTAMVGDHVLVKPVDPGMAEEALLAALQTAGASVRRRLPASGTWLVAFADPGIDTVPQALARLAGLRAQVRYAEPDYLVRANLTPNDPSFPSLWGLNNPGTGGDAEDADIDAPEAWDLHTGQASVVVAVIDSGVDTSHPDLSANRWTNPGEIAGNSVDDDGNGYVDDVRGWDFVNGDANPQDDNGHGTHCAGTIGAVGNNGTGVTGVCWRVSLMALKFLNASGDGALSDGVEAIAYATAAGASLTSNSWSGGGYSQAMKDVIDAADAAGILFVAAAGNAYTNLDVAPEYPASYTSANLLSVAATTSTDSLASFSNYGLQAVDLAAPGQNIYSTVPGGYAYSSGTSMAAPHVAGACALLRAFKPALSHAQIRELVLGATDPLPALQGRVATGGRLNVHRALLASDDLLASPSQDWLVQGPLGGPFTPDRTVYRITNHTGTARAWSASVDRAWITLSRSGGTLAPGEGMDVEISLNTAAANLWAGTQTATLSFHSPVSGRTQTRLLQVQVEPQVVAAHSLDEDPGWPRSGEWAYGTPQGLGGAVFGRPDPLSGATGDKVFGINLAGDYSTVPAAAQYLTAGPWDLSGFKSTRLRFQRWLNTDYQSWVYATLEVSTNGTTWQRLWDNGTAELTASSWTRVEHDLAAYADGQPQVYLRWGHRVAQADSYAYSGWNVDDIEILGVPNQQLLLTLPAELTEGGAGAQARLAATPVRPTDLVVSLQSSHPGEELAFPETVTLPAGQEAVTFDVSPRQDSRVDGTQTVTLTAGAAGYLGSAASLQVHDDEQGQLLLSLPAVVQEGQGKLAGAAQLSLAAPAESDVVIRLASSDDTEVQVPASVTLLRGQTAVVFDLTVPEDGVIDGPQSAMVTAAVTGWPVATANLQVTDNEPLDLVVSLPAARLENAGTVIGGGQVQVAGPVAQPLEITLVSDLPGELTVPAAVTLPAGTASVSFPLHLVDDGDVDGDKSVRITASAGGFTSGSARIQVADDETPALPGLPVPANGLNPAHPESDLAWQDEPNTGGAPDSYEVYFGTVVDPNQRLGSTVSASWTLPRLAPGTTYFWKVVASLGSVTRAGPVWSFTTPPQGTLHHFGWDAPPGRVARGVAFPVRVTALDEHDNAVPTFSSKVQLRAVVPQPDTDTAAGIYGWYYPLASYYHDARSQTIYTPAEAGPAGRLTALALQVSQLPGQTLKNFTLRLQHTVKTDYVSGGATWENAGWTTVHASDAVFTAPGWVWFEFSTPFDYDGVRHLMVDISFNNASYSSDGATLTAITPDFRTLAFRADSIYGNPLNWSGATPAGLAYNGLPNLRFRRQEIELALTPDQSSRFAAGAWSGSLAVLAGHEQAVLEARHPDAPAIAGQSSAFDVIDIRDLALEPEPAFTGGLSNTLTWAAADPGYEYEVQRATQADFADPVSSGLLAGTSHTFAGLADGQRYFYRVRGRFDGLEGPWSPVRESVQDATPPALTFQPASHAVTLLPQITLYGTALDATSGLASLTVADVPVHTDDGWAKWSSQPLALAEGETSWSVQAADLAVPPNVRTQTWTIVRLSDPDADPDRNGLTALQEHALAAAGAAAVQHLPRLRLEAPGQLVLSYRRRVPAPSNVACIVETSADLRQWQPAETEALSVVPAEDGRSETVRLRLLPGLGPLETRRFARLRLEILDPPSAP